MAGLVPAIHVLSARKTWMRGPSPRMTASREALFLPYCQFGMVENRRSEPMPECLVAKASEMQDGDRRIVVAGNTEIGVFYKDGDYFAYSNHCLHSGGPACEGIMINRVVDVIAPDRTYQGQTFSDEVHFVCPWHGYEYELKTGECVGDRRLRLKKYDVVRRGDDVFVIA
jgi:nitrite reductase/ring-hydroxylating ferredoxin subunit